MRPFTSLKDAKAVRKSVAEDFEWPRKAPPWPTAQVEKVSDGYFVVLNPQTVSYRPPRIYILDADGEEWGLDVNNG